MRIAVDVMGGDHAPDAILTGSLDALDLLGPKDRLALVGDGKVIADKIQENGLDGDQRVEVEATSQIIAMDESPVTALRSKTDSSIARLAQMAGKKHSGDRPADVIISAGNTGAYVAAAQMQMRRLPLVTRPGIAVTLPTFHGPIIICDVGANPDPKPHHLHQYAHMAGVYAQKIIEVASPRVALLSIGGEEGKGNALVRDTHRLIKGDASLNYAGYIEGRDLFDGKADVVVTEGFTGNVVLKLAEGLAAGLFKTIAAEIVAVDPALAMKFEPVVKSIYRKHDYHEYGGAPLLGANGICMICHGSSEARTIKAAIGNAIRYTTLGVNHAIVESLKTQEMAHA
ncbi:MAG: phosphate acyltransferase PlsX [Phycisphaeraceae bacterium]|nr:phosphate acyltransferase PlsX [Phycisphaeraceae bacterium]